MRWPVAILRGRYCEACMQARSPFRTVWMPSEEPTGGLLQKDLTYAPSKGIVMTKVIPVLSHLFSMDIAR